MFKRVQICLTVAVCLAVAAPASAQTCEPLNNGRLANVYYEGTALYFEPVVEFQRLTLTIGGPCEDVVKVFGPNDKISFDVAEIERITDGEYSWQLHREASIDPSVQKELEASRGSGEEDALWWSYFQKGLIPEGPYMDSGSFSVVRGQVVDPNATSEEKRATLASKAAGGSTSAALEASLAGGHQSDDAGGESNGNVLATKDTVLTNANGVIRNSLCVGFDCLNSNTYSDSTILLTENNTRIKFDDTSSSSSFPRNDWEIQANSNANGGGNYLGFNDCGQSSGGGCADDLVFAVEAGVRQHALYVESDGDVGLGTQNPIVRLHAVDGDTPALRLEQDTSNGFGAQTWDIAGNETSFFIRDATNGSTLPFRVFPGSSSNSLVVRDSEVGIGTLSPSAKLDVVSSGDTEMRLSRGTDTTFRMTATANAAFFGTETNDVMAFVVNGDERMRINTAGRVAIGCADPSTDFVVQSTSDGIATCATAPFSSLTAGSTNFTASSSRTIKENILPLRAEGILDKISSIDVYSYDFIDGPKERIGLMAEDFHSVFGRGPDDKIDGQDVQMALWLAVRELKAQNEKLTAEIEQLKSEK